MTRPDLLRQRGVASIGFSLIAIALVVVLLGGMVYWRAFQTQQLLTRAAGDGARAAHTLISSGIAPCHSTLATQATNRGMIAERVRQAVLHSLEQSAMPGDLSQQLAIAPPQWGPCPVGGESNATFELTYTLTPLLGGSCPNSWVAEPCQLHESSKLHFASML